MKAPEFRASRRHFAARLRLWARVGAFVLLAGSGGAGAKAELADGVLHVCADPQNMPFSNEKGDGFENKLVDVTAG